MLKIKFTRLDRKSVALLRKLDEIERVTRNAYETYIYTNSDDLSWLPMVYWQYISAVYAGENLVPVTMAEVLRDEDVDRSDLADTAICMKTKINEMECPVTVYGNSPLKEDLKQLLDKLASSSLWGDETKELNEITAVIRHEIKLLDNASIKDKAQLDAYIEKFNRIISRL